MLKKLFKPKCSQCRNEIPPNHTPKYVKMASRKWVKVCNKCFTAMGSPGKRKNVTNDPTYNRNQGRLW